MFVNDPAAKLILPAVPPPLKVPTSKVEEVEFSIAPVDEVTLPILVMFAVPPLKVPACILIEENWHAAVTVTDADALFTVRAGRPKVEPFIVQFCVPVPFIFKYAVLAEFTAGDAAMDTLPFALIVPV